MEITKHQILEIYKNISSPATKLYLEILFPDAFKIDLENGKYYKSNYKLICGEKSKFFVFIIDFNNQLNYGFDYSGKWCENMYFTNETNSLVLASTEEWNNLLIEQVKRTN